MRFLLFYFSLLSVASASSPQAPLNSSLPGIDILPSNLSSTPSLSNIDEPTPRLVMYVQTFNDALGDPLSLLPLLDKHTRVTHIILGSIHLHDEPGKIMLNNDPLDSPIYDRIWEEVRTLQDNGVKVLGLLGGAAAGTYIRLNGTEDKFNSYYQPLLEIVKKYSLDGLDVDIEEDVSIDVPLRLLNALYRDMGPAFLLTMAPLASALSDKAGQNLSGFSYFELDVIANIPNSDAKLVAWYNAQFYGGFASETWFYKSIVDAGWDPSRVVMGVLDSAADGNPNGFVGIEILQGTIRKLKVTYPSFGGVAGWEYFDAGITEGGTQPWEWVKNIGLALFNVMVDDDDIESLG